MQVFIGVDGGGSGCRAAVAFEDGARTVGAAGPANVTSDTKGAAASVRSALENALAEAGLTFDEVATAKVHMGLAGVLNATQGERFAELVGLPRATVTDDRATTVAGALGASDGIVAAYGTGAFVVRQTAGLHRGVGGWGMQISDHGSGAWLGRRLLEMALLALEDLGPSSLLTKDILAQFQNEPSKIVAFAQKATAADFAGFAPPVIEAADLADPLARQLMKDGARYIERAVKVLGQPIGVPLVLTGGVGPAYAEWLPMTLRRTLRVPQGSALDGALSLARRERP